ncbi:MAG: helix-turn-helix transcriptional regulator [Candidatus Aminicenantes bacterium]|nr:helix-turn-helix transcriptional regulator [Candidatus Aminicenantes bacterium]
MAKSKFIESVVKFILSRSDDELGELTVKGATYILKTSRSHFYHAFRDEMSMTPAQYLSKIKILRSAVLLETDNLITIKKISRKLGFSSADYFIRVFKEHFGTTPGRYRQYIHM